MDNATAAKQLRDALGLRTAPVAIAFHANPPEGVGRLEDSGPSSCSYWKYAAAGRTFYTESAHHYNCPIGAYTHNVELPDDRKHELQDVLGTMFSLEYVREDEIPGIPRLDGAFGVAVYAPLAEAAFAPDLVLLCGSAKQMMLVSETAGAAGVNTSSGLMGRPTCAALPMSTNAEAGVASLGCIGNRIYTEMTDEEMYFVLPAKKLADVVAKLDTIVNANRELEKYHQGRVAAIGHV